MTIDRHVYTVRAEMPGGEVRFFDHILEKPSTYFKSARTMMYEWADKYKTKMGYRFVSFDIKYISLDVDPITWEGKAFKTGEKL